MGKPEKKELQQAGPSKLSLGPLVSKTGKVANVPSNRQQLLDKVLGTAAGAPPTSLATVQQAVEQQLKVLSKSLDQQAAKTKKHIRDTTATVDDLARGHNAQANEVPPQAFKQNQIAERLTT
jgi:hypothetical protein